METMPRRELHALQLRRLQQTVRRVYDHVSFMRGRLDETGVRPDRVKTLDDLRRLPFTRKSDFRDTYPFGLLAVRVSQLVRIHASSGTTGKPTVVGYTSSDLRVWAEVCARCLASSGAQPGDVFQNAYGYGLFTGGMGMHHAVGVGGLVGLPVSRGRTERPLLALHDFGAQ